MSQAKIQEAPGLVDIGELRFFLVCTSKMPPRSYVRVCSTAQACRRVTFCAHLCVNTRTYTDMYRRWKRGGKRSRNMTEGPLLGSQRKTHIKDACWCIPGVENRENSGMSLYCCKDQDEKSMVLRRSRVRLHVNMGT